MALIFGGVGLGVCSACRAPGAFWYPPALPGWFGVWICDSCQSPETVHARISADRDRARANPFGQRTSPAARRGDNAKPAHSAHAIRMSRGGRRL